MALIRSVVPADDRLIVIAWVATMVLLGNAFTATPAALPLDAHP